MSTNTTLAPELVEACDRAAGRSPVPPDAPAIRVRAAHKDVSARGSVREQWYRLALVLGEAVPRYFSDSREPCGMRSAARHWTGYGEVPAGTILLEHDRGRPIDRIWLVHQPTGGDVVTQCAFTRRADGRLSVTLPDGTVIAVPDPRRR